jgi:hypothetical protein
MLIDAKSRLQGSREEYKRAARDIHGPEAVSAEKDIVCGHGGYWMAPKPPV